MKEDYLHALEVIGKILLLTPIIIALPILLYGILTGTNVGMSDISAGYSAGLMMFAGLFILIYVSYQSFRKKRK